MYHDLNLRDEVGKKTLRPGCCFWLIAQIRYLNATHFDCLSAKLVS